MKEVIITTILNKGKFSHNDKQIHEKRNFDLLTIPRILELTGKNLCFTQFSTKRFAALRNQCASLHNQFSVTLKILYLRGFILKATERAPVLLKNSIRDFQNSPPFERSACFYVKITKNFEHLQ